MVERYVFAKLRAEHATQAGRAEARRQARALAGVSGASSVRTGEPADDGALHAWDISVVVRFADAASARAALTDPAYAAFERYLASAAQVVKQWSFVLQQE